MSLRVRSRLLAAAASLFVGSALLVPAAQADPAPTLLVPQTGLPNRWAQDDATRMYESSQTARVGGAAVTVLALSGNQSAMPSGPYPWTGSTAGFLQPGSVRWVATHGYSRVSIQGLVDAGVPVSASSPYVPYSYELATVAALWHFAAGRDPDRVDPTSTASPAYNDPFLAIYDYLVAHADPSTPVAGLAGVRIAEPEVAGTTAAPIGPLLLTSPGGSTLVLTGAPAGTRIVDADGGALDASVPGATEVYLSVPACNGSAGGSFAVSASGPRIIEDGAIWGPASAFVTTTEPVTLPGLSGASSIVDWSDATTCPAPTGSPGPAGPAGPSGDVGSWTPIAALTFVNRRSRYTVRKGGSIVFTVAVENRGTATATNVLVVEALPPGFVFTGRIDPGMWRRRGVGTTAVGDLAAGAHVIVSFRAVARRAVSAGLAYAVAAVRADSGTVAGVDAAVVKVVPRR